MRKGYILLHRQGITQDEWKHPRRTLAWIDVLTLVDHKTGVATMSYGFLATRWRVSKATTFEWIKHWITERQLERLPERDTERNAERYFVVNYAKYQKTTERETERESEPEPERSSEQRYTVSSTPSVEHHQGVGGAVAPTPSQESKLFFDSVEVREKTIGTFVEKFGPAHEPMIRAEMQKFVLYWTEAHRTGKKVRWESEKHFDVKRRLVTWFTNIKNSKIRSSGSLTMPENL